MATKIVVDAGHGGSNPGAVYQGRRESDDALRLAMAVGRILEENGYDVSYTRTTDTTQSVGQKAAIANEEGADLFVSIHRNAAEYPGKYSGVQTQMCIRDSIGPVITTAGSVLLRKLCRECFFVFSKFTPPPYIKGILSIIFST